MEQNEENSPAGASSSTHPGHAEGEGHDLPSIQSSSLAIEPAKSPDPYRVGYGRPPRATQFQPGKSGNPNGRKRGSKNFVTLLQAELDKQVVVTDGGKRKKISKQQATVTLLVNKVLSGDQKALATLIVLQQKYFAPGVGGGAGGGGSTAQEVQANFLDQDDEAVFTDFLQRARQPDQSASIDPSDDGDGVKS